MKDYLKQELQVGDVVIYYRNHYRNFKTGRIVKITKCFVFIDLNVQWKETFKQAGYQVIKHPDQNILDSTAPKA
jgi:hypothetical protein